MDDLGEYRCCSSSLGDLEGISEEGLVLSHRANQTLIHCGADSWSMISFLFCVCVRERGEKNRTKRVFSCKENRTLKAWPLRLVPACFANPTNSLKTQFRMMYCGAGGCPLPGTRMQISHMIYNWMVSMVKTSA